VNRSSTRLQFANEFTPDQSTLPPEVRKLFPRERQIAAIVYGNGLVTARDVEFHLAQSLTNSAVRSFLNRLVRKGLLLQQRCGKRRTIIYAPALTDSIALELAIKQFAEDFYDGSLAELADEVGEFFSRPPPLAELLEAYDRSTPLEIRQLSSRMSEIADIVYRNGASSNREIRSQIGDSLTRSCIKTLLGRMVLRGLIRKRPSGRHREFVYLPALVTRQVRRLALKRFIESRFAGSAGSALRAVLQLTHARSAR
jgi:predicted transcriptional regulator